LDAAQLAIINAMPIAPDNTSVTTILNTVTAIDARLPSDPADASVVAGQIAAIPSAPTAAANATAVRSELAVELARIDVATSEAATPAEVASALVSYDGATQSDLNTAKSDIISALPVAPDNAGIAATKLAAEAVDTRLPAAPADQVTVIKTLKAAKAAPLI
jgi:hypothetical protein